MEVQMFKIRFLVYQSRRPKSALDLVQPSGLQEVVAAMFSCFVVDSL